MVIAPAHEPSAAPLALAIAKVCLGIETAPMHAELKPGARLGRRDLSLNERFCHRTRSPEVVEYPSNKHRRTRPNNDGRSSAKLLIKLYCGEHM
jgi:hypothetical protein